MCYDFKKKNPTEVFKAHVVVQPQGGNGKGIVLCLDSGDSKEIKLSKKQREELGISTGSQRFCIGSLSQIKDVKDEVTECGIVALKDNATLETAIELDVLDDREQNVISLACLQKINKLAILNPGGVGRKSIKPLPEGLPEVGIKNVYCTDITFAVNVGAVQHQIPIWEWAANVPKVKIRLYADWRQEPFDLISVWDTGASVNTVRSKDFLNNDGKTIQEIQVDTMNGEMLRFQNVRAEYDGSDDCIIGCPLLSLFKVTIGGSNMNYIGLDPLQ